MLDALDIPVETFAIFVWFVLSLALAFIGDE